MSAKGDNFMAQLTMDKLVALAKNRGFVYPGSEIYGGLSNSWDYGPLGVQLKNNIKQAWWKKFVVENPYNVGLDSAIIMNPTTWQASGHIGGFFRPLDGLQILQISSPRRRPHRGIQPKARHRRKYFGLDKRADGTIYHRT